MTESGPMVSYLEKLIELGADVGENDVWASVRQVTQPFGWKIHLSSVQREAPALLRAVVPRLLREEVPFKVARDETVLAELNEGTFGSTQVGKFMTIYPAVPQACRRLSEVLAAVTHGFVGPRIISDLHIGGAVYVRYGPFAPNHVRDRLGHMRIDDPEHLAEYRVPFAPPETLENPFSGYSRRAAQGGRKRLRGPGYLLLKPLTTHAKGSVYLGLNMESQTCINTVIVKTGRAHCMSDRDGRDIRDRLQHQFELSRWLGRRARVPLAEALFDEDEHRYLILEHIAGWDFSERPSARFDCADADGQTAVFNDFAALSETVAGLHAAGVVHCDLSPRNVRVRDDDGTVFLLDLEMAVRLDGTTPPFQSGTPGFISPQQKRQLTSATADDIYSMGCLLANAMTGLDPRRLPLGGFGHALGNKLYTLSGAPPGLISLCCEMLAAERSDRPSTVGMATRFRCEKTRWRAGSDAHSGRPPPLARRSAREALPPLARRSAREALLGRGLVWLIEGGLRDLRTGLPLSLEIEATHDDAAHGRAQSYRLYRSASRGVAGVVYTIARLARWGIANAEGARFVDSATDWLLDHAPTPDDQMPGLHYGEAGVAVALAEAVCAGIIKPGRWFEPYLHEALNGPLDWPDLTHGAAGQGTAALICARVLGKPALQVYADRCADWLVAGQHADGSWRLPATVTDVGGTDYTGFAHGTAGIICFLIRHHRITGHRGARDAAMRGGGWLLDKRCSAAEESACIWPIDSDNEGAWHWWCHGGPGIALSFLRLFQSTGEDRFAEVARKALNIHPEWPVAPNLSQCHGLAGLGEIYLDAYRILGEKAWLSRAHHIAQTLLALSREDHSMASWLVENPHQATADLMIGCAGVLHFIGRLDHADERDYGMPLDLPD